MERLSFAEVDPTVALSKEKMLAVSVSYDLRLEQMIQRAHEPLRLRLDPLIRDRIDAVVGTAQFGASIFGLNHRKQLNLLAEKYAPHSVRDHGLWLISASRLNCAILSMLLMHDVVHDLSMTLRDTHRTAAQQLIGDMLRTKQCLAHSLSLYSETDLPYWQLMNYYHGSSNLQNPLSRTAMHIQAVTD